MRFLFNALLTGLFFPLFLRWSLEQADAQLKKMQDAAYDTPGAGSPLPPQVLLGAAGLIGAHFLLGSGILKQKLRVSLLALIVGAAVGAFMRKVGNQ